MAKIGSLLLIFSFVFATAQAEVNVAALVNRNRITRDETFTYTIRVTSDSTVAIENPQLPSFDGLELLNQFSGMEARAEYAPSEPDANGRSHQEFKTVRTQSFSYTLQPQREGAIRIGVAEIVVNGKSFKTQPITIEVAKGDPNRPAQPDANDEGDEDEVDPLAQFFRHGPFGGGLTPPPGSKPANPNDAFAIEVVTDKNKVYQNEQVTVSWYLLTTGLIRDLDTLKYPDLKNFWKEDIEIATQLNFHQEVIGGVVYKKALLASAALFPRKVGTSVIDPYRAKATVLTGGAFGAFGLGQPVSFTKASGEVKIEVLPLPDNKPANFSGAVGQFSIVAGTATPNVAVNQPTEIKVRVEGHGNAKLIDLPPLNLPKSVDLYEQKSDAKFFPDGKSYKDFTLLVIPREPGQVVIEPLTIAVFDPAQKKFVQSATDPIALTVTGTAAPVKPNESETSASPEPAPQTQPSAAGPVLITQFSRGPRFESVDWLAIWSGIFSLIGLGLLLYARAQFGWGRKKMTLARELKARVKNLRSLARAGKRRELGVEATNSIYFLLGRLTGQGGAHVSADRLWREMPPSVRSELEAPAREFLAKCELLSFAPEAMTSEFSDQAKLLEVIKDLEALNAKATGLHKEIEEA